MIEKMLAHSSSKDGSLSLEDYARLRIDLEATLPAPFTGLRSFFSAGKIGLIIPGIGRDASDAVDVSTKFSSFSP